MKSVAIVGLGWLGLPLALTKGIIICDTKFEFGLDENGTLTLMDEVLTPECYAHNWFYNFNASA